VKNRTRSATQIERILGNCNDILRGKIGPRSKTITQAEAEDGPLDRNSAMLTIKTLTSKRTYELWHLYSSEMNDSFKNFTLKKALLSDFTELTTYLAQFK